MAIPNRIDVVRRICESSPATFEPGLTDAEHDARRLALLPWIIRALNVLDPGMWGLLRKDDQGGKIPCDIAAWREPLTTVDVMTSTGASWQVHPGGVQNPAWRFLAVAADTPIDPPVEPPVEPPVPPVPGPQGPPGLPGPPGPAYNDAAVLVRLQALEAAIQKIPTGCTCSARVFGITVPVSCKLNP